MKIFESLFSIGLSLGCAAACAQSTPTQDALVAQAQEAFRSVNGKNIRLLQDIALQTRGHPLEAWTAYWAHTARIKELSAKDLKETEQATFGEFRAFKRIYGEQYVTDRLRNDWLLELGKRQDWAAFGSEIDNFVMKDDAQVDCYDFQRRQATGEALSQEQVDKAFDIWMRQREGGDGCNAMGEAFLAAGKFNASQAWQRTRRFIETERPRAAARVAAYLPEAASAGLSQISDQAMRWLSKASLQNATNKQLALIAVARLAKTAPESAAQWLESSGSALSASERAYAWGQVGRNAAVALDERATKWFAKTGDVVLDDEVLAWKVRAALRVKDWKQVIAAVPLMSNEQLRESTWTFWHARAQASTGNKEGAAQLYQGIASPLNFYGMLALEELGEPIMSPPSVDAPSAELVQAQRNVPGVVRAFKLFNLGLRNEAVREWNFTLRGMTDEQLHATAEVGCQAQIWDRCINTSERTKGFVDIRQRFAMPYGDAIKTAARDQGLDHAYVLGLIRQESRFITDARSSVGAGGLMQLMPATAKWTAKKLGLNLDAGVNDVNTNVNLGTGYLRLLKDEFEGSEALAAAAYNAGPGRPRKWRNMGALNSKLDAAAFAENVPFGETRDYVKRVLSNATMYAALISGKPQSLKARLKAIGPASADKVEDKELP
jgi:soluble lytic murein transglycosylase